MKLFCNSLLISLGILLPTSTVLAQSLKTSELASANVSNLEIIAQAETETDVSDEGATTTDSESVEATENSETTIETDTPSLPEDADQTEATTEETETSEETQTTPSAQENTEAKEPELTPEEIARQQKLIEADQLYKSGEIAAAEQLYREAKDPLHTEAAETEEEPEPFYDPKKLSPAGAVYWRQSAAGLAQQLETKTLVPLQFLVEQEPNFIPGYLRYAEALETYDQEQEALQVLERASTLYPNEPELLKATVTELAEAQQWLEASLAARQFALLNPKNPLSGEFETLADQYLEFYKSRLRSKLRGNAIANLITGALGYIFTGNLFGPISAVETTTLMLRGESAVGERIANRVQRQLPMLEDEEVLEYVREVGGKLASVAGRDEFEYEFHLIMDDQLNAFALPGGKVFVNAGAILKTKSEAELAGLLAHELAHAVLSHGFQLVTEGNLIANVTQYIPFGGTATNLIVLDYNRDMERQADALGTRILVGGGYAADGLYNLMVTLEQQEEEEPIFAWLSTHPDTQERINNLKTQIERNGYNRYTYEGVERHLAMQKRVAKLLDEYKKRQECQEDEGCRKKLEN
ncbi:M48 family metalloprotease [Lyngbya aestuarii]|uniref:M48 family metalloprotease n=1 Tax=Lyngbya aestuarii TaxID=118322 RepID=UPI00403D8BF3